MSSVDGADRFEWRRAVVVIFGFFSDAVATAVLEASYLTAQLHHIFFHASVVD